jgi:signal-transduction protein with cAMP-binding, CBS, and nucleotidyltransferase domain
MGLAPLTVSPSTTCGEVVRLMREHAADSTIVEDERNGLAGIVTEQDVVRRITFQTPADAPVTDVMTTTVNTIREDDYLYHAIAGMRAGRLQHMPVIDERGRVVGILQQHQALAAAAGKTVELIEQLTHRDTLVGMRHTKAAQVSLARSLFRDRVPASAVQELLTRINNDLYGRVVEVCLREMHKEGWGDPPVQFTVIVMGSGGRGESFLRPDQDNGFILEEYPDAEHLRIDAWFIELAERMTRALHGIGFDYCSGYTMATNPLWRKTLPQWKAQLDGWIRRAAGSTFRLCDIFFDFTPVYGDYRMARELRRYVTQVAQSRPFLREMYRFTEHQNVALGVFGGLRKSKEAGPHRGKINLKLAGTMPLVNVIRVVALREGVSHTSTLMRIVALHEKQVLSFDEYDYLSGAFRHITMLLLGQQLEDFENNGSVGNHISPGALSKRNRDILIDGFKAISGFRSRIRLELTGGLS